MNKRQTAFVQNILDDPDENPAAAAKKAGYLKTTAEHKAYGWGKRGETADAIRTAKRARRVVVDDKGHTVIVDRNFLVNKQLIILQKCIDGDGEQGFNAPAANTAVMNLAKLTGLLDETNVSLTQNNLTLSGPARDEAYKIVLQALRQEASASLPEETGNAGSADVGAREEP